MCTAYELGKRGGSFPRRVKAQAVKTLLEISETRIVRPTLLAPVIVADGSVRTMSWGFRRSFAPKMKGRPPVMRTIVNSREDKLIGRTWSQAFAENRCLIPVASFFEWVGLGGRKFPMRFTGEDDGWLWIAGIWEAHPEHGECFSMITTEPNDRVKAVHDRMPAVLLESQIAPFLDRELHEFGPSSVELEHAEAANFLKPVKPGKQKPGPTQGELF